jgi:copper homeostasis protein|tara:strand:- start:335 stop:1024 length:690 start_codon:yes stop_codon:yes gene_type:complete
VTRKLEVCCTSYEDARIAYECGADRIEFCENISVGGVTPDTDLVRSVILNVEIPVFVLIRARGGDFNFNDHEVEEMISSIKEVKDLGVHGIVSGALKECGEINIEVTKHMVQMASPLPFTFHRAFDECADHSSAITQLREIGVDRILSSGGLVTASENPERISELVKDSMDDPRIICCGGVRSTNISKLLEIEDAIEFHSAASLSDPVVDAGEVRELCKLIHGDLRPDR